MLGMTDTPPFKLMKLRYAGTCYLCGASLEAKQDGRYHASIKKISCVECVNDQVAVAKETEELESLPPQASDEPEPQYVYGEAGAGAWRIHEQWKASHEEKVKSAHPKLGKIILALQDEPQHVRAWATGAKGEERLGKYLDPLAGQDLVVLHDRVIPGSRANIDHIVVTSEAVWVIDAKKYKGKPERRVKGMFSNKVEELWVNGSDRTKLIDGLHWQMSRVEDAIGSSMPVYGVLCFIEADFPLVGGSFSVRGVEVCWPRKVVKMLKASRNDVVNDSLVFKTILETFKAN